MWHSRFPICLFAAFVLFAVFCTSCNSNKGELTRSKALQILNQSEEITTPTKDIPVSQEGFSLADKEGWWRKVPWQTGEIIENPAKEYFYRYWYMAGTAELRKPLKRKAVEITGISDSGEPGGKEVDFKWEFSEVPDYIKKYAGLNHSFAGKSAFKLYDDGWRAIEVQF